MSSVPFIVWLEKLASLKSVTSPRSAEFSRVARPSSGAAGVLAAIKLLVGLSPAELRALTR